MIDKTLRNPLFLLFCAVVIIIISWGIRQSFGLFLRPISIDMDWGRTVVSSAIATQHLMVGLAVPFAGIIADRWGPARVLAGGGALMALGILIMVHSATPSGMIAGAGLITGLGLSGCGLPLVISVVGRIAPEEQRSTWLGVATAGATAGQFMVVPLSYQLLSIHGWDGGLLILAAMAGAIVIMAMPLGRVTSVAPPEMGNETIGGILRKARSHRGFLMLTTGFFVCGFQIQFMTTHIPAYLVDQGADAGLGATVIAMIGLFNMMGAWAFGYLGGRYRKKYLLCLIYGGRSIVILTFISLPVTEASVYVFAAVIGFLWLGTVPLTSGIVAQIFGTRYMATLYGIVYLSHQLGSSSGVWLGGVLFDATGSYDAIWLITAGMGVVAVLIHLPIDDRPYEHPAARPQDAPG